MPDKFEDLSTFIAILDAGGISAAATDLGIAKSAVSRRLSDLERRLGASLVNRDARRLEPTAVGVEYARRARMLLAALEELDTSVAPSDDSPAVTILADRAIIVHQLAPALAGLDEATRGLELRLVDELRADRKEDVDIVVTAGRLEEGARRLFTTTSILCASPKYLREHGMPEGRRQLDGHRIIVVDGDAQRNGMSMPDPDAAAAAAIAGLGIVRLPDYVARSALDDGSLVLVLVREEREVSPVEVFARCSSEASHSARRLFDAIVRSFG